MQPFRLDLGTRPACLALIAAGLLAYCFSFSGGFVFDDTYIPDNESLRHWQTWLTPPHDGSPVDSRPLTNLSMGINYAVAGTRVGFYHLTNIVIHIGCALLLYGIVRRTLASFGETWLRDSSLLAFTAAALWLLHPLQTESVAYISQRAENLMGFCYFATLYCFIRGRENTPWLLASIVVCWLGMLAKEVMVTAPVIIALYAWFFPATNPLPRKQNLLYFLGLFASLLVMGWLALHEGNRGGAVGDAMGENISSAVYATTQVWSVTRYLKLIFWPSPLIFDYGNMVYSLRAVAPLIPVLSLLILTALWGTLHRRWWAFCLIWFFLILSPTSTVISLSMQTAAEHRVYLSLAGIAVLAVILLYRLLRYWGIVLLLVAAVALTHLTVLRVADYHSMLSLWTDTVKKNPGNPRAYLNLGSALYNVGDARDAIPQFKTAIALSPEYGMPWYDMGVSYLALKRYHDARLALDKALTLYRTPDVYAATGRAYCFDGDPKAGIPYIQKALLINEKYALAHYFLAQAYIQVGNKEGAAEEVKRLSVLAPAMVPSVSP